jgi:hypothetical protein
VGNGRFKGRGFVDGAVYQVGPPLGCLKEELRRWWKYRFNMFIHF